MTRTVPADWFSGLILLLSALPLAPAPRDEVQRGPGAIDSVTLFSDRAQVVRRMDIRLSGKRQIVRFTDLPAAFSAEAMRAQADGVDISSLSVVSVVPPPDPETEPLREKIASIKKEMKVETDLQANLSEQMKILDSLARLTGERSDRELREGNVQLKAWADSLQFIEERRSGYQEKGRLAEERLARLKKSLKQASDEISRIGRSRRRSPLEVEVVCEGKPGDTGSVRLSYMVGGVNWNTVYDLHGSAEGTDFRVESHATIRQNTGENWKDVKITLSTARPSLAIAPPVLKPWRLHPGSPGTLADSRVNQEETSTTPSSQDSGSRETGTGDSATVTMDLPARLSIASDGSDHRVSIYSGILKGKVTHVAVPGLSTAVFLRASLRNTTGKPILWNRVNIFLDGGFVGTTTPGTLTGNGEEFELYLGPDQRMHVRRSLIKGDIVGSGLISKTVEIENRWQIDVANFTKKPQAVVIYEQVPVSGDPGITTKYLGSSLPDSKIDANGLLSWTLDVRPGETKAFDFGYSIQIPQPMWEALQTRGSQEAQPADSPTPQYRQDKPSKKKYDLERMFMK